MNNQSNKSKVSEESHRNAIFPLLIGFVIGLGVMFIPSWYYVKMKMDDNASSSIIFTPNAMAESKPIYLQILKTQQEVDAVKAAKIYLSDQATIGAGIQLGHGRLDMYLKRELDFPTSHVQDIGPQVKDKVVVNGYTYIPNAILTVDPFPIQILETFDQVELAKKMEKLAHKQFLTIGAAVVCREMFPCYVTGPSGVKRKLNVKRFITLEAIKTNFLKPEPETDKV